MHFSIYEHIKNFKLSNNIYDYFNTNLNNKKTINEDLLDFIIW